MKSDKNIQLYWKDIVEIAYESYKKELVEIRNVPIKPFEDFERHMNENAENASGRVLLEEGKCTAFLLYNMWEENGELYCRIPEWGYGSLSQDREKSISYLFQVLAEDIVGEKTVNFSVHLYANDSETQRLFSYMEFGIQAETGICILDESSSTGMTCVRELQKEEVESRWKEIWCLLEQLIQHLRKSPVFYLGEEFTEEVYKEFFAAAGTSVFVAEKDNEIIGLIESNADGIPLLFSDGNAANVGEIYVLPQYRGEGIAQDLLQHAKQKLLQSNYQYAWVEHGTANPNARYFWNRHFSTYKYEMIRRIESK